ncbi:MAG: single-stranded DNA-binding protein [Clostridia bacterium]|nr:single-stranded DNA-binding protein [Clostridia bacterium]
MSSLNLNKVILAGHITHDPEQKQTPSGVITTSFNIAVNRRYEKDGKRDVDFLTIVAWRQTAEFICRYFKKGSAICVVGSIQTRSWQDQHGNKRYATEIVADEACFVDGKTGIQGENTQQSESSQFSAPTYTPPTAPKFEELKTDDDLPF